MLSLASAPHVAHRHGVKSPAYRPSVLAYHHLSLTRESGPVKDSVYLGDFERQMDLVKRHFPVLSLNSLVSAMKAGETIPARTVVITFDDGYRSTYTRAQPILLERGIKATVFLATDFIGRSAPFPWLPPGSDDDSLPMTWQEAAQMHVEGMEVGSHTATHRFPPRMTGVELEDELLRSRESILGRLGRPPVALALPFSFPLTHRHWPFFKANLLTALRRASYTCCCTLQRGPVSDGEDPVILPRVAVMRHDGIPAVYAKALGLYRYTSLPQQLFQGYFKKYG